MRTKETKEKAGRPVVVDEAEARANARLIAAAPELLEACEEWVEIDGPYVSYDEQRKRWSGVVDKMRAAIKKARGQ